MNKIKKWSNPITIIGVALLICLAIFILFNVVYWETLIGLIPIPMIVIYIADIITFICLFILLIINIITVIIAKYKK